MILIYALYLLPFLVRCEKIIKNINIPACRNCIHYKPNPLFQYISSHSKCDNFGEKDIITDEINYDYVDSCRRDETKCGNEGKHFLEDPNLNMKVFKFTLKKNTNIYILIILMSFIIYIRCII
jgi:hypothetical protein